MGTQVYLVEATGRECSHPVLLLLGFGKPEGRAVCAFGQGPLNHQGRWGEGGDLGMKCKGGGHSLWEFVQDF